jgi:uncharacterized protein (TIGR02996 family)
VFEALLRAIDADPADETPRLALADWLDETDRPDASARVRWWAGAGRELRAAVTWDEPPAEWSGVEKTIKRIRGEWCRRLYAVEVARVVREKYPLAPEWAGVVKVADETLAVAERFALLLATEEELSAASSAACSAASSAACSAASSAAWSAASSAAWSAASSAAKTMARLSRTAPTIPTPEVVS